MESVKHEEVKDIIPTKKKSMSKIFLSIAKPDEHGFSRKVTRDELIKEDERFNTDNGAHWCRADQTLGKFHIKKEKTGRKVTSWKLDGFNHNPLTKVINPEIRKKIISKPCAVLGVTSDIEPDHKNAKYNELSVANKETQLEEDFQPLSRNVNLGKRQHCSDCKKTGKRFDAKRLHFSVSFIKGDENTQTCTGCYWHDVALFHKTVSDGYVTDK